MAADARAGKQRARPRVRRGSGYFFFLGFLTSFFGLLSLAMYDPPLQLDYNRSARESEGRKAGSRQPGDQEIFFLGFLTSFFGLLSLAMYDPPLQLDYNRSARESEGRKAGSRQPGDQASGSAHARPASEPTSGLAFWRVR